MDPTAHQTSQQDNAAARANATIEPFTMGYWRWLLFAAMARLELREDIHLRIPNAKATRHIVKVP